jgi:hypothetical protein
MNKFIEAFNAVESSIKEARKANEQAKKEAADETIETTKSMFDLIDEANRFVESIGDDSDANRICNYIKSRMKKGK